MKAKPRIFSTKTLCGNCDLEVLFNLKIAGIRNLPSNIILSKQTGKYLYGQCSSCKHWNKFEGIILGKKLNNLSWMSSSKNNPLSRTIDWTDTPYTGGIPSLTVTTTGQRLYDRFIQSIDPVPFVETNQPERNYVLEFGEPDEIQPEYPIPHPETLHCELNDNGDFGCEGCLALVERLDINPAYSVMSRRMRWIRAFKLHKIYRHLEYLFARDFTVTLSSLTRAVANVDTDVRVVEITNDGSRSEFRPNPNPPGSGTTVSLNSSREQVPPVRTVIPNCYIAHQIIFTNGLRAPVKPSYAREHARFTDVGDYGCHLCLASVQRRGTRYETPNDLNYYSKALHYFYRYLEEATDPEQEDVLNVIDTALEQINADYPGVNANRVDPEQQAADGQATANDAQIARESGSTPVTRGNLLPNGVADATIEAARRALESMLDVANSPIEESIGYLCPTCLRAAEGSMPNATREEIEVEARELHRSIGPPQLQQGSAINIPQPRDVNRTQRRIADGTWLRGLESLSDELAS